MTINILSACGIRKLRCELMEGSQSRIYQGVGPRGRNMWATAWAMLHPHETVSERQEEGD